MHSKNGPFKISGDVYAQIEEVPEEAAAERKLESEFIEEIKANSDIREQHRMRIYKRYTDPKTCELVTKYVCRGESDTVRVKLPLIYSLEEVVFNEDRYRLDLRGHPLNSLEGAPYSPQITEADFSFCNLRSLKGIEQFPNLRELRVSHNRLTDLEGIIELSNLKRLYIDDNYIKSLEGIQHLKNLETFDGNYNEICSLIPLADLTELKGIGATVNKIIAIPEITKMRKLIMIEISNNPIEELPYLENPMLKIAFLNHNRIRKTNGFGPLPSLENLFINDNPLGLDTLQQLRKAIDKGFLPKLCAEMHFRNPHLSFSYTLFDWGTKETQNTIDNINTLGFEVLDEAVNIDIPDESYKVNRKIGEGGTFHVIRIEEQRKEKISRRQFLSDQGLDPNLTSRTFELSEYRKIGISPKHTLKEFIEATNRLEETMEDIANRLKAIESYKKADKAIAGMMTIPKGTGRFYCILVPKKKCHQQHYLNYSGYRMLRDIGGEELYKRVIEIHQVLNGLPGIPRIVGETKIEHNIEYNKSETITCLVEECIEGETLGIVNENLKIKHNVKENTPNTEYLRAIGEHIFSVLEILSGIHSKKVIHNDISPNNIIVADDGTDYIIDYALSRLPEQHYMGFASRRFSSPELLNQEPILGPSSDIYSVSVMTYFLITGKHPFCDDRDGVVEIVSDRAKFEKARDKIDYTGIPDPISELLDKNFRFDPRDRFEFASDYKFCLRNALKSL